MLHTYTYVQPLQPEYRLCFKTEWLTSSCIKHYLDNVTGTYATA